MSVDQSAVDDADINVKDNDGDSDNNDFRSVSSPGYDEHSDNASQIVKYSANKTYAYESSFQPINFANNYVKHDHCSGNIQTPCERSFDSNFHNYYFNMGNMYNEQFVGRSFNKFDDNLNEAPCDLTKYNQIVGKVNEPNTESDKEVVNTNESENNDRDANHFEDNTQPINFAYYHF